MIKHCRFVCREEEILKGEVSMNKNKELSGIITESEVESGTTYMLKKDWIKPKLYEKSEPFVANDGTKGIIVRWFDEDGK